MAWEKVPRPGNHYRATVGQLFRLKVYYLPDKGWCAEVHNWGGGITDYAECLETEEHAKSFAHDSAAKLIEEALSSLRSLDYSLRSDTKTSNKINKSIDNRTTKAFLWQIVELKCIVQSSLTHLSESELKRLIDKELPFPQHFEDITKPTFIDEVVESVRNLKPTSGNSNEGVVMTRAYTSASSAKRMFDACFRCVLILKQCKSRKTNEYLKSLENLKELFLKTEKELHCLIALL